MSSEEYGEHGFKKLGELYEAKPYQGQDPRIAKVIFLGRDANYPQALTEDRPFFNYILEYHQNGVAFWEKYKIHHPFLHPENPFNKNKDKRFKAGVKYHRVFAKMGLDHHYAKSISFAEILNKATAGNTGEDEHNWFSNNIDDAHIAMLEQLFSGQDEKIVFIFKTVLSVDLVKVYKKTGRFGWLLDANRKSAEDEPDCILTRNGVRFYKCNHFSGAISNHHLSRIERIIREGVSSLPGPIKNNENSL
jgi:hypothetical protein